MRFILCLLCLYLIFPMVLLLIYSLVGGINALIPNRITTSIINYLFPKDKENTLLRIVYKLYPFLKAN